MTSYISSSHLPIAARFKGRLGLVAFLVLVAGAGALVGWNPQVALLLLGAEIALCYIVLCYARPFVAFAILVFVALTVWLSSITILLGLTAMVGLGLIFTGVWAMRLAMRQVRFVMVKEYRWLGALTVIIFLSLLFNLNGPAGIEPMATYIELILFVVLTVNFVTTVAELKTLSYVVVASSVLLALPVILNQYGWLPEGLQLQVVNAYLNPTDPIAREAGLWGDPNFTAVQLIVGLPFILVLWSHARRLTVRLFLGLILASILWAFTLTFSITGLVGIVIVLLFSGQLYRRRRFIASAAITIVTVVVVLGLASALLPNNFVERIAENVDIVSEYISTPRSTILLQVGTHRGDTWQAGLRSIANAPVLGHGPGNGEYTNAKYALILQKDKLAAHNVFLDIGSDIGLVGLTAFAGLLLAGVLAVSPLSSRAESLPIEGRALGKALFVALVAMSVQGMGLDIQIMKILWLLIGMTLVFKRLALETGSSPYNFES